MKCHICENDYNINEIATHICIPRSNNTSSKVIKTVTIESMEFLKAYGRSSNIEEAQLYKKSEGKIGD